MAKGMVKAGGVLLGSTALAAMPGGADADVVGNDTFATAEPVAAAVIVGSLNHDPPVGDLVDIYRYTLNPGDTFSLLVNPAGDVNHDILAEAIAGDQTTVLASELILSGGQATLTEQVPAGGTVFLRLTLQDPVDEEHPTESYTVSLTTTPGATVPLPASLALAAAGLVGAGGLHIARRRRAA